MFFWAAQISSSSAGSAAHVWHAVASVFAYMALIGMVTVFLVIFFNWPKFVVPPAQRNEPGVFPGHLGGTIGTRDRSLSCQAGRDGQAGNACKGRGSPHRDRRRLKLARSSSLPPPQPRQVIARG
jgi:hypothetical protein